MIYQISIKQCTCCVEQIQNMKEDLSFLIIIPTLDMYVIISREVIWYRDKKHTSRSVGKTSNEVSKLYAQRNVEEN